MKFESELIATHNTSCITIRQGFPDKIELNLGTRHLDRPVISVNKPFFWSVLTGLYQFLPRNSVHLPLSALIGTEPAGIFDEELNSGTPYV